MRKSQWDQLQMDQKISRILDQRSHNRNHHFGTPFLTAYQIAIIFQNLYPNEFKIIGKPIGGKGTRQQDSLAQYIALELSKRIKHHKITNIEGRFLFRKNLDTLQYKNNGKIISSSSMQSSDLSLFRLIS